MAQTWDIDPATGDYKMENGDPVETDSLRVAAYFRLRIPRGSWMYAPDEKYGSDFSNVKKSRASSDTDLFEKIAARALQPIVDDGRASEITVEATVNPRHAVGGQIKIVDTKGTQDQINIPSLGV
jgi:phage gp46-like protein